MNRSLLAGVVLLWCAILPAGATITYRITALPGIHPPLVKVDMHFSVPRAEIVNAEAPAWCPGDDQLQNFGKYVTSMSASSASGSPFQVTQGKQVGEWQVHCTEAGSIDLQYFVPEVPPGNFSNNVQIEPNLLFINGPAALLYLKGRKLEDCELFVHVPTGWQISTTLHKLPGNAAPGWSSTDYDQLADAPLLAATHLLIFHFKDGGCRYSLVFFHHLATLMDPARWVPVFQRIARAENHIMGFTPYKRYHFLMDAGGGLGGLEHLNSCRLAYSSGMSAVEYAPFVAHELFHSWNVKRLRPAALGPFNYQVPNVTRCLWFSEGITEYFAWIACRRAGIITAGQLEKHFREIIRRYRSNPARNTVSADIASLKVWSNNGSYGYQGLSYYEQGELIGLCLDLEIRRVTDNHKDLASLMQCLYRKYALPAPGFHLADIAAALDAVTGRSLTDWFLSMANTTAPLPLRTTLGYAGMTPDCLPEPADTDAVALRNDWLHDDAGESPQLVPSPEYKR